MSKGIFQGTRRNVLLAALLALLPLNFYFG